GITPQVLSIQFAYFSGLQSWAPILIPILFFVLGNLAAVVVRTLADRLGRRLAGRVHFGRPGRGRRSRQSGGIPPRDAPRRLAPAARRVERDRRRHPHPRRAAAPPRAGGRGRGEAGPARRLPPRLPRAAGGAPAAADVRLADDGEPVGRRAPRGPGRRRARR